MATLLPSPTSSSQFFFPHHHHHLHNKKWPHAPLIRLSFANFSSPFSLQETSQPTAVTESDDESAIENSEALPIRGCKTCGREEVEKGCNGEGRIQGGIATVPGFGWWPIKAYRPCPGFIASGGRYRRRGQNMDEVAFGKERENPIASIDQVQSSSKKRQSPRGFKR